MKDHTLDNEHNILLRLKSGDQEALSVLYYFYSDALLKYVQRAARSPFLAEDVVHDTFLKIWQGRSNVDPSKPFKPYLFVIARHTLLSLLKRARLEADILSEIKRYAGEEDQSTQRLLEYNESQDLVNEAIDQLSPQVKRTFLYCRIQGMSYKQAALALNVTESTVNKHISKALQSIRAHLLKHTGKIFLFFFICYWMFLLARK